jgi:hypothetical protein
VGRKVWSENLKGRDQLGDLGVDASIMLQEVLGRTNSEKISGGYADTQTAK